MNSINYKFCSPHLRSVVSWKGCLRFIAILFLAAYSIPSHATATATLDRNPIRMGETLRLVVTVDQDRTGDSIDYSELEKDFEVLGTSNSTQINISNGRQTFNQQWLIDLAPKRKGALLIPSLRIGGELTQPLHLTVLPTQVANVGSNVDFFVEVDAEPKRPYVQEQVLYTVRLFHATNVVDGSLSEPVADNLVIEKLGDDSSYESRRNGRIYRVVQRRYALFGQRSGKIVIPPIRFLGQVRDLSRSNSMFNRFLGRGRRVQASSDEVRLQIRPKPAQFTGTHWLPASQLVLSEMWPKGVPKFRVGEPVTRTLKMRAIGLSNVQLPELSIPDLSELKVYPEPAKYESLIGDSGIVGEREQSMAIVPSRSGNIILPAVKVVWWDVKNDVQKQAVIPAKNYTVLPPSGAPNNNQAVSVSTDAPSSVPNKVIIGTTTDAGASSSVWQGLSIVLAVVWLMTLGFWWRERAVRSIKSTLDPLPPELVKAKKALKAACFSNDARLAYRALMQLAVLRWPDNPPSGIRHIALRCHDRALMVEIDRLDRTLYSPNSSTWDGRGLWGTCAKFLEKPAKEKQFGKDLLMPLHLHQQ